MPLDYKDYHPKWSLIRRLILKRANDTCEECGLLNGQIVMSTTRKAPTNEQWRKARSSSLPLKKHGMTKVVLTIAHMDHDKDNNRFDNLRALCQKDHLHIDRYQHQTNRKYGRNWKRDQTKLEL